MEHTWRDTTATALVAAVPVVYVAHVLLDGGGLGDIRLTAGVVLALGVVSRWIGGRRDFAHERRAMLGNIGSVAVGVAAIVTSSEILLALSVSSILALWAWAAYVRRKDALVVRQVV